MPSCAEPLPASPLVEADWLIRHRDAVTVLDASVARIASPDGFTRFARGGTAFLRGHLPGARFADVMGAFSDPEAAHPFTRPTAAGLTDAARALGLKRNDAIVVYDSLGGAYAARLWCVLRDFGHERARVLNGGLQAWTAAGGAVETGPAATPPPGDFTARGPGGLFVGKDEVLRLLAADASDRRPLLCALRGVQYRGEDSTDPRRGHIPASLNLPYPDLLAPDGRLEPATVRQALERLGLGSDIAPLLYCGGGINAAGLALALDLVGVRGVRIYDDSMNGWRADPTLPVVHGPDPGRMPEVGMPEVGP